MSEFNTINLNIQHINKTLEKLLQITETLEGRISVLESIVIKEDDCKLDFMDKRNKGE